MTPEFKKKFLKNRDHTGRYLIVSFRTGKTYAVEPIGDPHVKWGDLNPATGKIEGKYGSKYRGSIDKEESLIAEENGFKNITTLKPGGGVSIEACIDQLDSQYPDKQI